MRGFIIITFAFLLSFGCLKAQKIDAAKLRKDIIILASDSFKGRKTGSVEGMMAVSYIRSRFRETGLELYKQKGIQSFQVNTDVKIGPKNDFQTGTYIAKQREEFLPLAFSENGTFEADVVFAGYGFNIDLDSLKWDDYNGLDVKGKWVLILKGDPEFDKSDSKFIPYSDDRSKVLTAKDKGAAGVLLVSGKTIEKKDNLPDIFFDKTDARAGVFAINITRSLANRLLKNSNNTIDSLEACLNKSRRPLSFPMKVKVKATVQVALIQAMAQNVIALLPGSDSVLKSEYIVVGAHFDHLGMGGHGSGSRKPDTLEVHNGADDNASGVAGMLALAGALKTAGQGPRRSVIFVAFSGEEMGLVGSKQFIKKCPVPISSIKAMINLDMIGRLGLDSGAVMIGGTGTSAEAGDILSKYVKKYSFRSNFSPEGFGASDHSSFYIENIPVFFFTTGVHSDYHTPEDDADLINYSGEKEVLSFAYDVLTDIANRENNLSFREAGPKMASRAGTRFKVTLGILPDFTSSGNEGLRIDGVSKDRPAYRAGLLKGDIITAVNGKSVKNIYEYMDRLKTLEAGTTCSVDIKRNGKIKVFLIQL